jgi:hypothetical protein
MSTPMAMNAKNLKKSSDASVRFQTGFEMETGESETPRPFSAA